MSYAVIATGGKQQRVAVGDKIKVEKLDAGVGDPVTFEEVLAVQTGDEMKIGRPTLEGARVVARVLAQDNDRIQLREKTLQRMSQEISTVVAVQFLQVQYRFETMADLKAASYVPIAGM